jgi:hypothetical protein
VNYTQAYKALIAYGFTRHAAREMLDQAEYKAAGGWAGYRKFTVSFGKDGFMIKEER